VRIPLSAPDITEDDIAAVVGVLRTPRLSLGPKLEEFEEAAAGYVGVPYGVALSSGTAGLHLGLAALGIGEGDEVILPSFTFIAAANAVLHQRARPGVRGHRSAHAQQPLYAAYVDRESDLTVTEQVAPRTLALPFFNRLADSEIAEVCLALREAIETTQSRRKT
jgi:dTDP-4-amino-4,6-dideoxygalactose transaminase